MDAHGPRTVRITLVHRAFVVFSAAGHARFSGWHPSGADRGVPGHQAERERESRETLDQPHHSSRMLDRRGPVKRRVASENANSGRESADAPTDYDDYQKTVARV